MNEMYVTEEQVEHWLEDFKMDGNKHHDALLKLTRLINGFEDVPLVTIEGWREDILSWWDATAEIEKEYKFQQLFKSLLREGE